MTRRYNSSLLLLEGQSKSDGAPDFIISIDCFIYPRQSQSQSVFTDEPCFVSAQESISSEWAFVCSDYSRMAVGLPQVASALPCRSIYGLLLAVIIILSQR